MSSILEQALNNLEETLRDGSVVGKIDYVCPEYGTWDDSDVEDPYPEPECVVTRPEFGDTVKVWDVEDTEDVYLRLFVCEVDNIVYTVSIDTEDEFKQGLPFSVIQWDMMEVLPDEEDDEIEELKYQIEYLKGKVAEYEDLI